MGPETISVLPCSIDCTYEKIDVDGYNSFGNGINCGFGGFF